MDKDLDMEGNLTISWGPLQINLSKLSSTGSANPDKTALRRLLLEQAQQHMDKIRKIEQQLEGLDGKPD